MIDAVLINQIMVDKFWVKNLDFEKWNTKLVFLLQDKKYYIYFFNFGNLTTNEFKIVET